MFVVNRAIPDIHQTVMLLSTRVKEHNENFREKLMTMIKYLNGTKKNYLTLSADDLKVVKWYVDASFSVQLYFKSHTGEIVNMGKGVM